MDSSPELGQDTKRKRAGRSNAFRSTAAAATVALGCAAATVATAPPAAAVYPPGCATTASHTWDDNCWVGTDYTSAGNYVAAVQQVLHADLYYSGCLDGSYGAGTESAVESLQAAAGLSVDGIVGSNTWSTLYGDLHIAFMTPGLYVPGWGNTDVFNYAAGFEFDSQAPDNSFVRFQKDVTTSGTFEAWFERTIADGSSNCNTGENFKQMTA